MSLNYNTELALINTTTNSGTITLPSATTVPGRVISFKDSVGNFNNKSLTLICDGSDTFEDGTVTKVLYESFGSIQVVASGTKWFILSGVKQNATTISSLITSTISTYSISFSDGSFQTISADKSINSSIIGLGSIGYLSSFNLISSLNISSGNIFTNTFTTQSISTNLISSGSLLAGSVFINSYNGITASGGNINMNGSVFPTSGGTGKDLGGSGAFRWNNFWVSTISSIHTQSSTITATNIIRGGIVATDRLTGGTQDFNTFTNNLFPTSASAGVGYGPTTAGGGYYKDGYFRSTFTSVIQPDAVAGQLSNVVRVNGNLSTQNIFSSTINSGTITLTTGGFTRRVVSSAVAPSGTVTLNLTSGNVFYFTTAMGTSATANFTTLTATVGSTYYVNFLTGLTPGTVTFTGNTGATTLSITGLSLVGNPSVSIGLHGAAQSFTPADSTRYMFTCIAIAT
jgi:hypothetical protein